MPKNMIRAAAAALVLTAGAAFAQPPEAPTNPQEQMSERPGQGMPMMGRGSGKMGGHGMMGGHGIMGGHGMMGGHGHGGMHSHMMLVMMALVDSDASGTLSLEEVQAVHGRLFQYADTDDDGELTIEELRAFIQGKAMPTGR